MPSTAKLRFQFVMANAEATAALETDKERREIQKTLGGAAVFFDSPAPRLADVVAAMDTNKPTVVHFSAHGSPANEIMLLSDSNRPKAVSKKAITELFHIQNSVRLVVLSACFSADQAESLKEHVDCVIGVSANIPVTSALRYSLAFYEAIANKLSVAQAHQRATILMFEDRLTEEFRPQLFYRPEINPTEIFLLDRRSRGGKLSKTGAPLKPKVELGAARFDKVCQRYKVHAESYSVTKFCHGDGSSELVYELNALNVDDFDTLDGLYFSLESAAGLVTAPIVDARADELGIRWDPDEAPEARTLEDVINRVRRIKGKFIFSQALRQSVGSYTFGWTIRVVNMDAVTEWEFANLYNTEERRRHLDGGKLDPPKEFFARIVWLPMRTLTIRLQLPAGLEPAKLQYFELDSQPEIPKEEIASGGCLWSFPPATEWFKRHAHWKSSSGAHQTHNVALNTQGVASDMTVSFPVLGSYYSLDWRLLKTPIPARCLRLVKEAEVIRKRLLGHRARRADEHQTQAELLKAESNPLSRAIIEAMRNLYRELRKQFEPSAPDEKFETTLMTYDDAKCRLVVAEGVLSEGEPEGYTWTFSLPFGLGLAGACFRAGTGAFTYARSRDARNPLHPDAYLEIPGSDPHEYVITLPIDHPDLASGQLPKDFQRCRQLIGVISISSTYAASGLLEYCHLPAEEAERAQLQSKLAAVRDVCQRECDRIARLLLGKTEKGPTG